MERLKYKNIGAGLLSGGFETYGTGVSTIRALIDLFENYKEYSTNPSEFMKKHPDLIFSGRITKVVTDRVIRPYVIVSDKLEYADKKVMSNIIRFNIDLFAAYFLQAIKILANVYGVDLTMIARQVTDRNLIKSAARTIELGKKALNKFGIGREDISDLLVKNIIKKSVDTTFGLEDDDDNNNQDDKDSPRNIYHTDLTFKDGDKNLGSIENVIRVVNVDIKVSSKDGDRKSEIKLSIPFIVAPIVVYTNSETFIKNALGIDNDETFTSRWLKFKSGEIGLWDLIFAGDLINEYKRNRINNKNDIADLIRKKNLENLGHNILTMESGFTSYTNIYILDISDQLLIEDILEEDLIEPDTWQKLALKLLAFDINFVDVEKERLINFITDMPTYSVLNFRDIKKKTKEDDINDILKALLVNKPVF